MAITSKEINLAQLDKELGGKGLNGDFSDPKKKLIIPTENSDVTEEELEAAISAHIAIDDVAIAMAAKTAAQAKLEALGLTTDDLKALGL
jgi:hypothetical protein